MGLQVVPQGERETTVLTLESFLSRVNQLMTLQFCIFFEDSLAARVVTFVAASVMSLDVTH